MKKYGFVYIWYDKHRKMYYIGCHWGTETDGYLCSSNRMRNVYKRRPEDFKRRILKTHIETREQMFKEEQRYLDMIKLTEISPNTKEPRYYNLHLTNGHWSQFDISLKTVGQKISKANKGKRYSPATEIKPGQQLSPETQFQKGVKAHNKGKTLVEQYGPEKAAEIKEKQRLAKLGKSNTSNTKFQKGMTPWNAKYNKEFERVSK